MHVSEVAVINSFSLRTGQHGYIAHASLAIKADDQHLIVGICAQGPDLLAFVLVLELSKLRQLCVRLRIGHAKANAENLRWWQFRCAPYARKTRVQQKNGKESRHSSK